MTATYTFDVLMTLDGFGSYDDGDWGGYWGKQGPEFLERRREAARPGQRLVVGANTYRQLIELLDLVDDAPDDPNALMLKLPMTVVSSTLVEPLDWPGAATVAPGDAVATVWRLKADSDVSLRSFGSLSMNRALMAAGLVDLVQVTIFPVISGQTGAEPIFEAAADFDLELIESRTLDGRTQELIYRPALHG